MKAQEVTLFQKGLHLLDNYGGFVGVAIMLCAVFMLVLSK
jgi:hypothetical protein